MADSGGSIRAGQNAGSGPGRMYPLFSLMLFGSKSACGSRQVKNKAVYVALGVTPEGEREVLGYGFQ